MDMSGHNTSIAKNKLGCRLPYEHSDIGDGYAASGEIKVYRLTPEEVARRYGPPVPRRTDNFIPTGKIVEAASACENPEEAAEMLGISVRRLKWEIGSRGIKVEYGVENHLDGDEIEQEQKPEKKLTNLQTLRAALSKEKYLSYKQAGLTDKEIGGMFGLKHIADYFHILRREWGIFDVAKGVEDVAATRREQILEKLTREQYLDFQNLGKTDKQILQELGLPYWPDVWNDIKGKWGVKGMSFPVNQQTSVQSVQESDGKESNSEENDVGSMIVPDKEAESELSEPEPEPKQEIGKLPGRVIEWAHPRKIKLPEPILRIHDRGLNMNKALVNQIGKYVRVGYCDAKIVLQPVPENNGEAYRVNSCGKIKSVDLWQWFMRRGVGIGRYRMKQGPNGYWEGDVSERIE